MANTDFYYFHSSLVNGWVTEEDLNDSSIGLGFTKLAEKIDIINENGQVVDFFTIWRKHFDTDGFIDLPKWVSQTRCGGVRHLFSAAYRPEAPSLAPTSSPTEFYDTRTFVYPIFGNNLENMIYSKTFDNLDPDLSGGYKVEIDLLNTEVIMTDLWMNEIPMIDLNPPAISTTPTKAPTTEIESSAVCEPQTNQTCQFSTCNQTSSNWDLDYLPATKDGRINIQFTLSGTLSLIHIYEPTRPY